MEYFRQLGHHSNEIVKFAAASGIFSLLLKCGKVIHFTPQDPEHFRSWLIEKNIEDIKSGRQQQEFSGTNI
ncbi:MULTISPECIES: hypothetical protein [Sphingobacterium]|jgi:hypothetical protein|uniref:hypothetical protein n=1 Tax=Sphingobacterium TaxID=28453 RepID=UPI0029540A32|nr:hypothetical protein [Sphingobacterium sp. UGAL515B_05]WON95177.1 hypothetical protein OK025_01885 [Sphingobacterium sp. UGAL515B_05]